MRLLYELIFKSVVCYQGDIAIILTCKNPRNFYTNCTYDRLAPDVSMCNNFFYIRVHTKKLTLQLLGKEEMLIK
jgi:hypothetical protein